MYIFNSSVKRETLKLIETFLDKAEDQPHIGKQFVPPMMDPVLGDYARNLPDARESEVLSLFATIINKYCLNPFCEFVLLVCYSFRVDKYFEILEYLTSDVRALSLLLLGFSIRFILFFS